MSDTPETDENSWNCGDKIYLSMRPDSSGDWVLSDFARKLERERDELKKRLLENEKYGPWEVISEINLRSRLEAALVERDEYKRRWQDWERWAKQMVQYFRRVPLDTDTVGMRNTLTQWMQERKDAK